MMNMDVSAALGVAIRAHAGQVDKAGRPYIMHVVRVMAGVPVGDEDAQIVAALHDVVEDTDWTVDELRVWFAPHICDAVDAMTKRDDETRKEYLKRVEGNALARTVKMSDLDDNRDLSRIPVPTERDIDRSSRYLKELIWLEFGEDVANDVMTA